MLSSWPLSDHYCIRQQPEQYWSGWLSSLLFTLFSNNSKLTRSSTAVSLKAQVSWTSLPAYVDAG
jgi:hypothetical protein